MYNGLVGKAGFLLFPATLRSIVANHFYHKADWWQIAD
jgi:hypothetical protein